MLASKSRFPGFIILPARATRAAMFCHLWYLDMVLKVWECFCTTEKPPEPQPSPLNCKSPSDFSSSHQHLAFGNTCWLSPPGHFLPPMSCHLPVSPAKMLISILLLFFFSPLCEQRSPGLIWNKQFSVFPGALPHFEEIKHSRVFPGGPHPMPGLRKVEAQGGSPVFPFLTADLKAYLSSSLIAHSLAPPNAGRSGSCFSSGHKRLQKRNGKQGIWWL